MRISDWSSDVCSSDLNAGSATARPLAPAKSKLPAEFDRRADGLPFTALTDGDIYAPQVGWSEGFPVGRDPTNGWIWLAHCYGMEIGRASCRERGCQYV